MAKKAILPLLILLIIFIPLQAQGAASDDLVQSGRALLETQDLVGANEAFKQAVESDPSHQEANFFYSLSRIFSLIDQNQDGPDTTKLDSIKELLDAAGVSQTGRTIYDMTADFERDASGDPVFPVTFPTSGELQQFVLDVIIPEIDGAIINLSAINTGFETTITPGMFNETDNTVFGVFGNVQIDYGDIAFIKSYLYL